MGAKETRYYRELCRRAGVLPSEMHEDPKLGLCLSPSGIRKLAALAPDQTKVAPVMDDVARAVRGTFKVVKPRAGEQP